MRDNKLMFGGGCFMPAFNDTLDTVRLDKYIDVIQEQNRKTSRLDGWFLSREIMMNRLEEIDGKYSPATTQALLLEDVVEKLPLSIRAGEVFAGTEDDAFACSYALINPGFKVENFEGYCDEDAVYNDIKPDGATITQDRIDRVRDFWAAQPFAKKISAVYDAAGGDTAEAVFFVERVTGHTIPDFRDAMKRGIECLIEEISARQEQDNKHGDYYEAMKTALGCAVVLARRYSTLAGGLAADEKSAERRAELLLIADTCTKVPARPAGNLYEAIQSYIILWQVMNLEQGPNPFAFSVGNLDRILQPYYDKDKLDYDLAVQLVRHLLAFFCTGDRNWAISQNIMVGGMDRDSGDMTCDMSYVIMDAFAQSNYSQPNLSVKIHPATPIQFYRKIAEFMFDFGHSTPSFFSDPVIFSAMETKGIEKKDMPLYGIAGCQEPLVMGMENANTTNSWLNLAKVLELAITGGMSTITGKQIGPPPAELGIGHSHVDSLHRLKDRFYKYLDYYLCRMREAANGCTEALSLLPVPFKSAFMGARETGVDMRSTDEQGTKYNASGCLIHGLANVADSFSALAFLEKDVERLFGVSVTDLLEAVAVNYENRNEIRDIVRRVAPKYGNNDVAADTEVVELQERVSTLVNKLTNPLGNNFCADWSTPSTNLLYGWWTGATPDGRKAREALNYGLDPVVGAGRKGLLSRIASQSKLNYAVMSGGSAVALSINPDPLNGKTIEEKADYLTDVISAVFGFVEPVKPTLMYAYFNVFSADTLFDVMEHPENYPEPVLVRIHGQYGDARHLSPDILCRDIIPRLDNMSTSF